jgi:hypothetical protein
VDWYGATTVNNYFDMKEETFDCMTILVCFLVEESFKSPRSPESQIDTNQASRNVSFFGSNVVDTVIT